MMPSRSSVPLWITILILLCCGIEALLTLAPILGFDQPVRTFVTMAGAFWTPIYDGAVGLYQGQKFVMFLSYGLLHGGMVHLAMNMISLAAVGRELALFMRPLRMAMVYLASQIAAALVFAWMSQDSAPMVGASGAIFGLAGALIAQASKWRMYHAMSMRPILKAVLIIGGLNVALTFAVPQIAWQAHLGGAVAGLIMGLLLPLSRERRDVRRRYQRIDQGRP